MEPKARAEFIKKISINGFSIEDTGDALTLRPRGAEATAEVIIKEVEPNVWQVAGASGAYSGFYRGKKREYFERYINQWSLAAALEAPG